MPKDGELKRGLWSRLQKLQIKLCAVLASVAINGCTNVWTPSGGLGGTQKTQKSPERVLLRALAVRRGSVRRLRAEIVAAGFVGVVEYNVSVFDVVNLQV
jgi:hypothetical protein